MVKRLSNFVTAFMLGSLALFWLAYPLVGNEIAIEISSSLLLGAALTLALTWATTAMRSIWKLAAAQELEGFEVFNLGVFLLFVGLFWQRVYATILRWADRPDWLLQMPWGAFSAWTIACACALILLAPGTNHGDVPIRNKVYVLFSAFVGGIVAGITLMIYYTRG